MLHDVRKVDHPPRTLSHIELTDRERGVIDPTMMLDAIAKAIVDWDKCQEDRLPNNIHSRHAEPN